MEATSSWKISDDTVRLLQTDLTADLTLSRPDLGLRASLHDDASLRILGVVIDSGEPSAPREPMDAYARGNDLVVTYPQSFDGVRTQVYWQSPAVEEPEPTTTAAEIDVQVSVQTDRLDSRPAICVVAQVSASEIFECLGTDPSKYHHILPQDEVALSLPAERCVQGLIFRLANTETTFAQLLHPSDVLVQSQSGGGDPIHQTLLRRESLGETVQFTCSCGLFFEALEKGVIRRARVRGVFVPRENDLEAVAACARRLMARKLPLTT